MIKRILGIEFPCASYHCLIMDDGIYIVLGKNVTKLINRVSDDRIIDLDINRLDKDYYILQNYMIKNLYDNLPLEDK